MPVVLLDTSVASLLHPKRRNAPEFLLYQPDLAGNVPALSFQTVAELLLWAQQNRWGQANAAALDGSSNSSP